MARNWLLFKPVNGDPMSLYVSTRGHASEAADQLVIEGSPTDDEGFADAGDGNIVKTYGENAAFLFAAASSDYLTIDGTVPYERRRRAFGTSSGVLGWGLPAAIGVAIGRPGRETWCIVGDGSANFAIQALWSAARYEAPVAYVIMNNGQYQANRMNMERYPGRMLATGRYPGVSLSHPEIDFVSLARGYGVEGEVVADPGRLAEAFARAKAAIGEGRPYLVDVRVETRYGTFDPDWYGQFSIARLPTP